jgi:uncharacterized protein YaaN involved in tellurite resistance
MSQNLSTSALAIPVVESVSNVELAPFTPAAPLQVVSNTTQVQNAGLQSNQLTAADRNVINNYKQQLKRGDTQSVISYGTEDQRKVTDISERMLTGVRAKDTGVGDILVDMVTTMRGLDVGVLDPNAKKGGLGWFKAKISPIVKFAEQYETVGSQVAKIESTLTEHRMTLMRDTVMLDKLYNATLEFFFNLDLRITAITERIEEVNNNEIPAAQDKAAITNDMLDAQNVSDIIAFRDDLERKKTDLLLTRQVALQTLPSIRLMQENEKGLCNKIQSQILNGVPLWKNQIAIAISLYKQQDAAKSLKASTDFTNDMLAANAAALKQGTKEIRTQMERGVFDIEVVKKANDTIIASIEEAIAIADEGKRQRAAVEQELVQAEQKLKATLARNVGRTTTQLRTA